MSCWCSVPKCTNNSKRKSDNLSFFRFPKDPERWRKWIECINRPDLLEKTSLYAYKNCFVCSEHFEGKFFLNDLRNRLQPTAIPTLFKYQQNEGTSECHQNTLHVTPSSAESEDKQDVQADSTPQIVIEKVEASWNADVAAGRFPSRAATCKAEWNVKNHKMFLGRMRNQLCRICGTKQKSLSPICSDGNGEGVSLLQKIEMHLPVQISCDVGLPSNICVTCRELVESWHQLHVSCLAADSMLRKMFDTDETEAAVQKAREETSLKKKNNKNLLQLQTNDANDDSESSLGDDSEMCRNGEESPMEVDHTYMKSSSGPAPTPVSTADNVSHRCKYCGETFDSKKEIAQHKKPCSKEPAVCDMCGESVPQRCQLNRHIRKHLLVCTSFVCEGCDQKFTSAEGLQGHMNTRHNGEETMKYFCEPCCKLFLNEQAYKRHELHHEKGLLKNLNFKIEPSQGNGNKAIFICPVCEGSFNDKMSLIIHMNTARKKKCSVCKEWIRTEKQSLLHKCKQRICQYCGKRFNTRVGLYAHELIHKQEKRFACQTCGAKFVTSSAVIQHRVIHDPPSFQCADCGKQFRLRYSYEDHMREHLGIKHTCPYCEKKFTARKSLYRHKRKCHFVR